METTQNFKNKLIIDCANKALHSYGTAFIFREKNKNIRWKLNLLNLLGILVPLIFGGVAIRFGADSLILEKVTPFISPLLLLQLGLSGWALVYKWRDKSEYFISSAVSNASLSRRYETLAKYPPKDFEDFKALAEKLDIEYNERDAQDDKYDFSQKENRKGMRHSLRKFKIKCNGCKIQPISMKPSNCDVCGNF